MDCISPCPTGSIDNWRIVTTAYSLDEQLSWDELPEEIDHGDEATLGLVQYEASEQDASAILEVAHAGQSGKVMPPPSASRPRLTSALYQGLAARNA